MKLTLFTLPIFLVYCLFSSTLHAQHRNLYQLRATTIDLTGTQYSYDTIYNSTLDYLSGNIRSGARYFHEFANDQARFTAEVHSRGFCYKKKGEHSAYLNGILENLVPDSLTATRNNYEVFLYADPSINAFTTFPDHIYMNVGFIAECDNEAQLAAVMAHELGHQFGNDVWQVFHDHKKKGEAYLVSSLISAFTSPLLGLGVGIYGLISNLQYSRDQEWLADKAAIEMCTDAGYSLKEMKRMEELFLFAVDRFRLMGISYSPWLSTHPAPEDRITLVDGALGAEHHGTAFLLPEVGFYNLRKYCRYETVRLLNENLHFQDAIEAGWRYLNDEPNDIQMKLLTYDALRRYLMLRPKLSDKAVLISPYNLPTSTMLGILQDMTEDPEVAKTLQTIHYGNWNDPKWENKVSITYTGLFAKLEKEIGGVENCGECNFLLALAEPDSLMRLKLLKQSLETGSKFDHLARKLLPGYTGEAPHRNLVVFDYFNLDCIRSEGLLAYREQSTKKAALEQFNTMHFMERISNYASVPQHNILDIDDVMDYEAATALKILSDITYYFDRKAAHKVHLELFDPRLSILSEKKIKSVDFIRVTGTYVTTSTPGLALGNNLGDRSYFCSVSSAELHNGTGILRHSWHRGNSYVSSYKLSHSYKLLKKKNRKLKLEEAK